MDDAQSVAQLVMVDFSGTEPSSDLERLIADDGVGGVILFGKNIASSRQVAQLTNALQGIAARASRPPLLISIDQEGGVVVRVSEPATVFPSAMAIGATGSVQFAEQAGAITARELRAMGIVVNHAPVLDVNTNVENPIIGARAFGDDPDDVARLGVAYLQGLQHNGVVATAKHFPGHGDTQVDSHLALPTIRHDWKRLNAVELPPFQAAIGAGCDGIMTAHVAVPAIDPSGLPATLSPLALEGVLRTRMGFHGVVFTDSMRMFAIARHHSPGYAAFAAVRAGADVVLACGEVDQQREAISALRKAIERGTMPSQRLEASLNRLRALREKYGILDRFMVDVDAVERVVGIPEHRTVAQRIAEAAVTIVRDDARLLPLPSGRVCVVDASASAVSGSAESVDPSTTRSAFAEALRALRMEVAELPLDRLLVGIPFREGVRIIAVTRNWHGSVDRHQISAVQQLVTRYRDRLVVVATGNPYELLQFPEVGTFVATYSPDPSSVTAAARVLCGQLAPKGRLPVSLPGLYPRGHGLLR